MSETNGGGNEGQGGLPPQEKLLQEILITLQKKNEALPPQEGPRKKGGGRSEKADQRTVRIQKRKGVDSEDPNAMERLRQLMTPEKFEIYEAHVKGEIQLSANEKAAIENSYTRAMDFLSYWGDFNGAYFDQSDYEVLSAMFVPEKFIKYTNEKAKKIATKLNIDDLSKLDDKVSLKISEEVRTDMVLMFGNLLRKIDDKDASEFFDEIAQQDIFKGINIAHMNLTGAVRQLANHFEKYNAEGLKINLFKTTSNTLDEEKIVNLYKHNEFHENEKDVDGNAIFTQKSNAYQRIEASSGPKQVSIDEFVKKINIFGEHEYNTRKFLHNIRALSLAPPAYDKPHYSRMQGFAEQLSTTDLDEIILLPDYDVVSTAGQLYSKIIQEEFAKNDWKHTPTMFTREPGEIYTRCEKKALDQLTLIFRDRFLEEGGEEGGNVKKNDWRLRRAFDMAMGKARGIDMSEVEYAAYADPVLTGEGKPRFTSYYTTDPGALVPLDYKHFILRFQMEELFPMMMAPMEGEKEGMYDHKSIFKATDEFFNSFTQGKKAFSNPDQKLFIDILQNIGNIGGLSRRAGWRWEAGCEGHYVDNTPENGKNHLTNIKRIENIGYEIFSYYINNFVKSDFLEGKNSDTKKEDPTVATDRDNFFQYLFTSYIKPDFSLENDLIQKKEYKDYLDTVRVKIKEDPKIKDNKEIEKKTYEYILKRAQIGCIYNRFPSFLIKNERNRYSENGTRTWMELKQKKDKDGNLSFGDWDNVRYDQTMDNLGLAETLLRLKISQEMDVALQQGNTISDIQSRYLLDESSIEEMLKGKVSDITKINDVKNLFKIIKRDYLNDTKSDEYIKKFVGGDREYRYTVGIEELDTRYLSYRAAGFRPIARATGDMAKVESDVVNPLTPLLGMLKTVAVAPPDKRDVSGLIEIIKKAKAAIESIHGVETAEKVAYYYTKLVISFYRKDDIARPWLGLPGINRNNSMATDLIGKNQGVWEWDSLDIDKFLVSIESAMILRKTPLLYGSANVDKQYEKVPLKIFGVETPFKTKKPKDSMVNFSKKIRESTGATNKDILIELFHKFGMSAMIFLLYSWGSKAFQENFGGKKEGYEQ